MSQPDEIVTQTIRIPSTEWMHTPGMLSIILAGRLSLDSAALRSQAEQLWQLVNLLPSLPGQVLLDLIEGRRTWTVEGTTVVLHPPSAPAPVLP